VQNKILDCRRKMMAEPSVIEVAFTIRRTGRTDHPKPWWLQLTAVFLIAAVVSATVWRALDAGKDVSVEVGAGKEFTGKVSAKGGR